MAFSQINQQSQLERGRRVFVYMARGNRSGTTLGTAILVTSSIVPVVVIILIFVGFPWVKPDSLRLKIWNWFESELRGQDEGPPNAPSNAHERTP